MVKLIQHDLHGDNTIQVRNYVNRATLDIIGVAGMGHDFGSLSDPDSLMSKSYQNIFSSPDLFHRVLFMIGVLIGDLWIALSIPTRRNRLIDEGGKAIRDVARQMIRETKDKMKDPKADTGVDIISVALQSGDFDDENLVEQLMTFLAAGHETTASALQWAIYALCKHPEVQTRLREDVRANVPPISIDNPEPIDATVIDNLSYLHAVCNEILRFHPSVPITSRMALNDTTLVGKSIPKGTILILSPELVNHLPELWGPDAGEFNPDRFMGPGKANTGGASSNYAFLSFLHGPRSCIGQGFAKSEMACLLAAMVGSFKFELKSPDAKLEVREGPTCAPKDGVVVTVTPLDGW